MKKILLAVWIVLGCFTWIQCDDPYMDDAFAAYEELPVGEWLQAQPEFSLWVELMKKAELFDAVNVGSKFTCFVADNEAVQDYLREYGWSSLSEMDEDKAKLLVRYHLIADAVYKSKDLIGKLGNKTLSGDYLTAEFGDGGYNAIYINKQARVIKADQELLNSTVVHTLDKVLRPVIATTWDLIDQDSVRYSIFRAAALECRLDTLLSRYERKFSVDVAVRDYKTVFVESDSVFKVSGIRSLEELVEHLKTKFQSDDRAEVLRKFMYYHVSKDLKDFQALGTFDKDVETKVQNLNTYDATQLISVKDIKSRLVFNANANGEGVMLLDGHYDRIANNGYVHELDGVLYLTEAEPARVVWELTDYECFRALALYQKWSSNDDGKKLEIDRKMAAAEGVTWKTVPDDDAALKYYLRSGQQFYENDAVSMSLGYVGWAQFVTPVIAKGKYKITLHSIRYDSRGTAKLAIDNQIIQASLNFATGSYTADIGTVEFSEQSSHIFKITALKKGDIDIDCLIFTPVK